MDISSKFNYIHSLCQSARRILVVGHKKCPDATGAVLAFSRYLQRLQKLYTVWLPAPALDSLNFLAGYEAIQSTTLPALTDYDLIVALDSGDRLQTGLMPPLQTVLDQGYAKVINIDHHFTNDDYGHINVVDKHSPATCEMLYRYFVTLSEPIDSHTATCLLTGILTDTSAFSNASTNQQALIAAADLLSKGAVWPMIVSHALSPHESWGKLCLWRQICNRLRFRPQYQLAVTCITQKDLANCGIKEDELDGLANFFNTLKDIKMGLILMELSDGTVKGSLRTTRDDVDVSILAKALGGGGHKKAAGFTLKGRLIETDQGWQIL